MQLPSLTQANNSPHYDPELSDVSNLIVYVNHLTENISYENCLTSVVKLECLPDLDRVAIQRRLYTLYERHMLQGERPGTSARRKLVTRLDELCDSRGADPIPANILGPLILGFNYKTIERDRGERETPPKKKSRKRKKRNRISKKGEVVTAPYELQIVRALRSKTSTMTREEEERFVKKLLRYLR